MPQPPEQAQNTKLLRRHQNPQIRYILDSTKHMRCTMCISPSAATLAIQGPHIILMLSHIQLSAYLTQ